MLTVVASELCDVVLRLGVHRAWKDVGACTRHDTYCHVNCHDTFGSQLMLSFVKFGSKPYVVARMSESVSPSVCRYTPARPPHRV